MMWFKEAFDLPVLAMEEVDAQIKTRSPKPKSAHGKNISIVSFISSRISRLT